MGGADYPARASVKRRASGDRSPLMSLRSRAHRDGSRRSLRTAEPGRRDEDEVHMRSTKAAIRLIAAGTITLGAVAAGASEARAATPMSIARSGSPPPI